MARRGVLSKFNGIGQKSSKTIPTPIERAECRPSPGPCLQPKSAQNGSSSGLTVTGQTALLLSIGKAASVQSGLNYEITHDLIWRAN